MTQFDVLANPVARASYPFVVVLQSDLAGGGRERAVAPVALRAEFSAVAGRLTPIMAIEREEFVLLVTSLTTIPVHGLDDPSHG